MPLLKVDRESCERQGQRSPGPLQSQPQPQSTAATTHHNVAHTSLLLLHELHLHLLLLLRDKTLLPALGEGDEHHGEEEEEDEEADHAKHHADYQGRGVRLSG